MKIINGFHLKNVRGDILGGITAAVVALPLALAFGNAALGPGGAIYGLYGAVVVGFLAALFGGTPAQVSGPTGPMSCLLYTSPSPRDVEESRMPSSA